jgi:hypothetical protein
MATFKLLLGLGMTVVLLGIAGARLGFLDSVGASALSVEPGRLGRTGDIAELLLCSIPPDLDVASSSGATTAPTSEQ